METFDTHTLIQMNGDATLGSAAGLKAELLEALATGLDLRADLSRVGDIDLTVMQLLWAAAREAGANGREFNVEISAAAGEIALELGFEPFPGDPRVI